MPALGYDLDIHPAIWVGSPIGELPLPFDNEEYRGISLVTAFVACENGFECTGLLLDVIALQGNPSEGTWDGFNVASSEGFLDNSGGADGAVSPPSGMRQFIVGGPGPISNSFADGTWPIQVSANGYFAGGPEPNPDEIGPNPQLSGACTTRVYMRL